MLLHVLSTRFAIIKVEGRIGLRLQAGAELRATIQVPSERLKGLKTAVPDSLIFAAWRPYPPYLQ
jgi:hypothetical protein